MVKHCSTIHVNTVVMGSNSIEALKFLGAISNSHKTSHTLGTRKPLLITPFTYSFFQIRFFLFLESKPANNFYCYHGVFSFFLSR